MVDLEDLDNEKLIVVSYYVRLCQGGVVKASSHLEDMALIELRKVMIHGDILNIFRNNDVFDHWLFDLCESVDFLLGLSRAHIDSIYDFGLRPLFFFSFFYCFYEFTIESVY